MQWKVIGILFLVNLAYLLLGAMIFHFVESDGGDASAQYQATKQFKEKFLKNFTCVKPEQFDEVMRVVIEAYDEGLISTTNNTIDHWDYPNSIFFAATVVTTIGYGHISPESSGGKVFCIFYAIFGIPLCLILLGGLGFRLDKLASRIDNKLNMGYHEKIGKVVRSVLMFSMGFSIFVLIPSAIIYAVEDWGYGDSIYYALISLTTVGFGDYVPTQNPDRQYGWWYAIIITIWLMLGLSWCAVVISNCQDLYQAFQKGQGEEEEGIEELKGTTYESTEDTSAGFDAHQSNKPKPTEKSDLLHESAVPRETCENHTVSGRQNPEGTDAEDSTDRSIERDGVPRSETQTTNIWDIHGSWV